MRVTKTGRLAVITATALAVRRPQPGRTRVRRRPRPRRTPPDWTPQMVAPAGAGYVRQLTPCGNLMYVAGTFSQFRSPADGGATYTRNNALAFNATNGRMSRVQPEHQRHRQLDRARSRQLLHGVESAASSAPSAGTAATNIAAVDATTGAFKSAFAHSANGQVNALLATHGHLLVGGYFSSLNGVTRQKLASLNPTTGAVDSYLTLGLAGNYPGNSNGTRGYNFTLSHNGTKTLVTGDFTSVGGVHREQVFQLDLGASAATLNGWTSNDFYIHCADSLPFYIQDAAYSPDDSTIYVATTGYKRPSDPRHTGRVRRGGGRTRTRRRP